MNGALITAALVALCALVALRPWMPEHSSPINLQFLLGHLINEQPFVALWLLLWGTLGTLIHPVSSSPMWWLVTGLSALAVLALVLIAVRAWYARPVLSAALEDAFGAGSAPRYTLTPWWRVALLPIFAWRPDVRRVKQRYGPAPHGHRLDVYVSRRTRRTGGPVLVYLHGGGFRTGSRMQGARSLIYRLAAQGWVCISADYRLARVRYPDQLSDARAVLDWARTHAESYGGDPGTFFVSGGSAGAHLAATSALSGSDVSGVIALYGYYGEAEQPGAEPTSPHGYVNASAPPFLIVHGSLDTLILREDAREFAEHLRAVSRQPVAYAELPGTQHNFDFFHSMRFHSVTDAIVRFAELTRSNGRTGGSPG